MRNAIRSLVAFSALVISMQAGAAARNAAAADGAGAVTGVATYHARTTEIEAGHSRGNVALEDTTWRVTRLNDKDVVTKENQHAPYIVLASSEHRASGSGGCNRINGTYTVDKQTIHFGPMASTMMACPDGMDTEKDFMEALDAARKWKIQAMSWSFTARTAICWSGLRQANRNNSHKRYFCESASARRPGGDPH